MRDQGIWSIGFGRWNGVHVRLHMFFMLFAAFTIYLGWLDLEGPGWSGPLLVCLLLISVGFHELGHLWAFRRLGGHADEVVLGPLGGLGVPPDLPEPQSELVAAIAGPLTNLMICFLTALILTFHGNVDLFGLMYPLSPQDVAVGDFGTVALKMTFWINWFLIIVNFIPAFPFDGGQALKAAIMTFRPETDPLDAVNLVARFAKLTSVGLLVLAWIVRHDNPGYGMQTWFALVLLAIFVFFSARKAEQIPERSNEDAFMGYDFSEGYTTFEQAAPTSTKAPSGPIVSWWDRRRRDREDRQRIEEAVEDGRVDEILSRVHEGGIDSLSPEERDILRRASLRYRNRDQTGEWE